MNLRTIRGPMGWWLAASAVLWTAACSGPESGALTRFQDEVERLSAADASEVLEMKKITDLTWDRLWIFPPYTPRETISRELGTNGLGLDIRGIDLRDDICLLVFAHQGRILQTLAVPRAQGDLAPVYRPQGYTPETAIFRVSRDGDRSVISPLSPSRR